MFHNLKFQVESQALGEWIQNWLWSLKSPFEFFWSQFDSMVIEM
jgi:hypothetical protein